MKTTSWGFLAAALIPGQGCVTSLDSGGALASESAPVSGQTAEFAMGGSVFPRGCRQDSDCFGMADTCNAGICMEGVCLRKPVPSSTPCDDNDPCTVATKCDAGACKGVNVCLTKPVTKFHYVLPPSPL